MAYYLSLQYSAIQKTVLRHDRLWSIAGMSQILSKLNEIDLPAIAKNYSGDVFVAGGGKFTSKFNNLRGAEDAKKEIIKLISTTLPMLEFQTSEIVEAESLQQAKDKKELNGKPYPGLVNELSEQKRCFRGYGITFNPHLMVCDECGEYPATEKMYLKDKDKLVCRICSNVKDSAGISLQGLKSKDDSQLTSIERIYKKYAEAINDDKAAIPLDFEDLFPSNEKGEEGKKRLAIWSSDINGMGDKVTIWLRQDEEKIKKTFDDVKDVNMNIISNVLYKTFPKEKLVHKKDKESGKTEIFIPFRLIVAGGDDLCVVMKDRDILEFVQNISDALDKAIKDLPPDHPLNISWLEKNANDKEKKKGFKPHSLGGSFIVAPVHTPFKKMHHIAEELMSDAKKKTDRQGNGVNWLIMSADEEPESKRLLDFEKPLFIDNPQKTDNQKKTETVGHLTFNEYIELSKKYKNLSGSHIQQIIGKMIEFRNDKDPAERLETWLKRKPIAGKEKSAINGILREDNLRDNNKKLSLKRLATLFELMSIYREND